MAGTACIFSCTLLALLCLPSAARAQDTGSITGTVRDSSGAVVPDAEVKLTSGAIGLTRPMTTNGDGDFLAAALPPGTYDLLVTAKGFKTFEAKGIIVRVAQKARVDVTLQVGQVSENVVVEGSNVAQVETQSSDLSGVVTGKEITQLELNGRSWVQLVALVPGVSNQTGQDFGGVGLNQNINFSINGGRGEYNNWQVDGANAMDTGSNGTLNVFPSVDAIGEFRVMTSNYGAQYGRNGSGTIEVVTKSGTKDFHGDVFEFARNEVFNARNYFDGVTKPPYKRHDYGYTLGGPVFIPRHYNARKDETFFFFSEEWRRESNPTTFDVQVPSLGERMGNFSDVCPADPASFARNSFPDCPTDPNTGAPFPNNQLSIDPNGALLLPMISPPTTGSGPLSFFRASRSTPTRWREELLHMD